MALALGASACASPAGALAQPAVLLSSSPVLDARGIPQGWEPLTFKKIGRRTEYSWSAPEHTLHALSSASASGLLFRLDQEAAAAPLLRWRWRVSHSIARGNERSKKGDDYAARVYVTFKYDPAKAGRALRLKYGIIKALYGEYPPHSGISYIWANRLPKGESVPNAYTGRVRMLALRSGEGEAGRWAGEERDILADYRRLYGEDPPPLSGVALMTDTDDTASSAEAWYADIELLARP